MTIHREGYRTLGIAFIFLAFINLTLYRMSPISALNLTVLVISVFVLLFLLYFFRDPKRQKEADNPNLIYTPADGKVVVIEETIENEYFKDKRLMISVFMSPLNVHANYHPVSGTVIYKRHHHGKYLVAWHPKASEENERTTTVYDTGKMKILVRQVAGAMARRIVNYAVEGQEIEQGDELGFIKFGSRVDIYLPVGTAYLVNLGQKVQSRCDVLART